MSVVGNRCVSYIPTVTYDMRLRQDGICPLLVYYDNKYLL
jgi:hypothetical protein